MKYVYILLAWITFGLLFFITPAQAIFYIFVDIFARKDWFSKYPALCYMSYFYFINLSKKY